MRSRTFVIAAGCCLLPVLSVGDWPAYRGPGASGVGQGAAPASWNGDASTGPLRLIKWKTPIPGLGHSSPVITGGKLFVTTAISSTGKAPLKVGLYGSGDSADDDAEQQWVLYCLDQLSGKVPWRQTAHRGKPKARRHTKATHANTTVATDGKRVIAFFGSEGLYSYTLNGKLEWQRDLGTLDMAPSDDRTLSWGFASSPVLFEDTVIVQSDSKKDGLLAAFAAADGRELWRVARASVSVCSWATPGVCKTANGTQIVANGYPYIAGYDFQTGKELWRLKSEGDIPVPTPFMAHGLIYVANAHGGKSPRPTSRKSGCSNLAIAREPWQRPDGLAVLQQTVLRPIDPCPHLRNSWTVGRMGAPFLGSIARPASGIAVRTTPAWARISAAADLALPGTGWFSVSYPAGEG